MLNHPEVLIYLWLFPVVTLLLIPLAMVPVGLIRSLFRGRNSEKTTAVDAQPVSNGKKKPGRTSVAISGTPLTAS